MIIKNTLMRMFLMPAVNMSCPEIYAPIRIFTVRLPGVWVYLAMLLKIFPRS